MASLNDLIVSGKARFLNTISGNIDGTSNNVTGTVAIAHGGTGATTRLGAAKALTDETVATPGFVVGLTDSWGSFGYTSIANLKTTIGSAAAASGGTAITMCTTGEKYTWNNKLNLSGGTMTGDLTVGVNGSSYPKSYAQLGYSTSDPSIKLTYQPSASSINSLRLDKTGISVLQNASSLNIKYNDLEFSASSNPPTWDGTNTSLVTAVTQLKNTKADILAETIPNLTFSGGVATLAKKTGYILINIYPYARTDDGYGITSFTEQNDGSYKIRNNYAGLNASLKARAIWLKV